MLNCHPPIGRASRLNFPELTAQFYIRDLLGKTEQVGSISTLVSDLANQTTMLAMNAAVEAVRAGDRGRGFAVVSNEIRQLADRSSRASVKEIGTLIVEIQQAANRTAQCTATSNQRMAEGAVLGRNRQEKSQSGALGEGKGAGMPHAEGGRKIEFGHLALYRCNDLRVAVFGSDAPEPGGAIENRLPVGAGVVQPLR